MAGSLNHIVNEDGTFTTENLDFVDRDSREALEECHQIIAELLPKGSNRLARLHQVCEKLSFPRPKAAPVIQPEFHGAESAYRAKPAGEA